MIKLENKLQLELHVEDFEPIKDYYKKLGFEIAWERPPEGKRILSFTAGRSDTLLLVRQ